ncbi:UTP--glucose-1-phosphate uridylyltransferase-like, partial [Saccostrea cucullata]|uniref:UTP--glucose-1-phosphate uridylyltransferase-like n=1 Tax=Saccostrea cuccullata TaxID=36930 RepID=UPI002ED4559F
MAATQNISAFVRGHRRTGSDIQFIERTRLDAQKAMNKELQKLIQTAPPGLQERIRAEFDEFEKLFGRYLQEAGHAIQWEKIRLASQEAVKMYNELKVPETSSIKDQLNKLVVIKLNGGLGTSMGCKGPKSIISVRNDLTFLDLTVQQIEIEVRDIMSQCQKQSHISRSDCSTNRDLTVQQIEVRDIMSQCQKQSHISRSDCSTDR